MSKPAKTWETYEQVAQHLLDEFAVHFELARVEGKQVVPGQSGATWEIDAKGVSIDGEGFMVIECKREKTRLPKRKLTHLAYSIRDTKAAGGIVVTPLDLQAGAKKIAAAENIVHVKLSPESTTTEYVMSFLDRAFIRRADTALLLLKERATLNIFENGKLDKREYE